MPDWAISPVRNEIYVALQDSNLGLIGYELAALPLRAIGKSCRRFFFTVFGSIDVESPWLRNRKTKAPDEDFHFPPQLRNSLGLGAIGSKLAINAHPSRRVTKTGPHVSNGRHGPSGRHA